MSITGSTALYEAREKPEHDQICDIKPGWSNLVYIEHTHGTYSQGRLEFWGAHNTSSSTGIRLDGGLGFSFGSDTLLIHSRVYGA